MAEKVYLTSDQYVVKLLEEKEQEIVKLNEKYDDLLKRFVISDINFLHLIPVTSSFFAYSQTA